MATPSESLICPITFELFHDPVLAQDGHTYEREAIEKWIRKNGTSPITRQQLSLEHLYPNHIVKKLVATFETTLKQKDYQFILDVDVKKKKGRPLFQTYGKTIYHAEWLPADSNQPEIILLKIDGARALKEASFYVNLTRHPHVVRTFGFVLDKQNDNENTSAMLIQEYASEGSLNELIQERRTSLDEKILIEIFLQIIDAMIFLAYNHVVHGDLACRNVLIFRFDETNPKNNIVKVTDFGLSRQSVLYSKTLGSGQTTLDIIPIRYAAPEILLESSKPDNYTEKSDVYSMGVLMWEAYSKGALPWAKIEKDAEIIRNVMNNVYLTQPPNCSPQYWDIILKTWSKLPRDRPTFEQLKHLLVEQSYLSVVKLSQEQTTSEPINAHVKIENVNEVSASETPISSNMSLTNENRTDTNVERVISKTMIDEQVNTLPSTQPPSFSIRPAISPQSLTNASSASPADMNKKREYMFKVLIIGEIATGKTALVRRYVHKSFSKRSPATIGADFYLKIVKYDDDTTIHLQILNISGQERFGSMTKVFYKDAAACFIVFDVTRGNTFEGAMRWKTDLDSKVQLPDGNPLPCCDLYKEGLVNNAQQMDEFCREKGFVKWFEVSAKENVNIEVSFKFLISEMMKPSESSQQPTQENHSCSDTIKVTNKSGSQKKNGSMCSGGNNSNQ